MPTTNTITNSTAAEIANVFASLKSGDVIEIHTAEAKPRIVTVHNNNGRYALVTSGKVRPGHIAGGTVGLRYSGEGCYYQPTLQQKARVITALNIIGTSH